MADCYFNCKLYQRIPTITNILNTDYTTKIREFKSLLSQLDESTINEITQEYIQRQCNDKYKYSDYTELLDIINEYDCKNSRIEYNKIKKKYEYY
tara:strand:+ start:63 stop:347 length:285 start_codon:yes stop_codon:yes gene_type:complete